MFPDHRACPVRFRAERFTDTTSNRGVACGWATAVDRKQPPTNMAMTPTNLLRL
jgi:hypothetical protein